MRIFLRLQQYRAGLGIQRELPPHRAIAVIPERPQASKRAKTVLRMTKMTLRSKKMIEMIRIDKQAPFLD